METTAHQLQFVLFVFKLLVYLLTFNREELGWHSLLEADFLVGEWEEKREDTNNTTLFLVLIKHLTSLQAYTNWVFINFLIVISERTPLHKLYWKFSFSWVVLSLEIFGERWNEDRCLTYWEKQYKKVVYLKMDEQ